MLYSVIEEVSEAIVCITSDLQEAIEDAKSRMGKYLVLDDHDIIMFDSEPNISYKI